MFDPVIRRLRAQLAWRTRANSPQGEIDQSRARLKFWLGARSLLEADPKHLTAEEREWMREYSRGFRDD